MVSTKDKDLYAIVAQEVLNNTVDTGLWAKAFAECGGNEQQAKALYLKLRVADLKEQETAIEKQLQQEAKQRKVAERERQYREREVEEAMQYQKQREQSMLPIWKRENGVARTIKGVVGLLAAAIFLIWVMYMEGRL